MADSTPKSYHTDPTLYLYTSLTAGSSHITTATSRLETILKANRIPFQALDVATDEKARMLWGRRAGKRKLPGLVRMGMLVGDLPEIEEWNEYGELKDHLGGGIDPTPSAANTPSKKAPATTSTSTPSKLLSTISTPPKQSSASNPMAAAMRQAGAEAAKKAGDAKSMKGKASTSTSTAPAPASTTVTPTTKPASENAATGDGADDDEEKAGEDPDTEAVVAGSKDTINVKEGNAKNPDPDAEAVVPGSKDTIGDHGDGSKTEEKEPKEPDDDEEEKDEDSKPTSAPTTTPTPPPTIAAKANPPQPTPSESDSESETQTPPTSRKTDTAATDKGQDLPGKKTQAQAAAKAEDAGTSVGD
ncbi:MAG: hypothetical protein L6R36_009313 [Xanthoria steineri]|nr:MAG: hypothetical protein L6R36_009313 [Xanthoria steineri]